MGSDVVWAWLLDLRCLRPGVLESRIPGGQPPDHLTILQSSAGPSFCLGSLFSRVPLGFRCRAVVLTVVWVPRSPTYATAVLLPCQGAGGGLGFPVLIRKHPLSILVPLIVIILLLSLLPAGTRYTAVSPEP